MRIRRILGTFLGVFGTFFIGLIITLFLVFPRVVNQLADLFGNMGNTLDGLPFDWGQAAVHVAIAVVIDLLLVYFFILRPTRRLRESLDTPGLEVRKGAGRAYIDTESVRQRVIAAVGKVADIQHADVLVENESGRAIIRLNIVTDVLLNGPKKKNEINREVRKVVEDQLGVDVKGKPTINFTLTNEAGPVPMIAAGSTAFTFTGPTPTPASATARNMASEPTPEPEMPPIPQKPSGIELAKSDPLNVPGSKTPVPQPIFGDDPDSKLDDADDPMAAPDVSSMLLTADKADTDDTHDDDDGNQSHVEV